MKAPAAKPRSTTGALMPQDELGSEPAPYHWRGFERKHSPTTPSLNQMGDWLIEQGVESVAMESTYVYWIPIYELLESRGLEVVLVNARQLKNVPGRKTDMHDCQWLQLLHSCWSVARLVSSW